MKAKCAIKLIDRKNTKVLMEGCVWIVLKGSQKYVVNESIVHDKIWKIDFIKQDALTAKDGEKFFKTSNMTWIQQFSLTGKTVDKHKLMMDNDS